MGSALRNAMDRTHDHVADGGVRGLSKKLKANVNLAPINLLHVFLRLSEKRHKALLHPCS